MVLHLIFSFSFAAQWDNLVLVQKLLLKPFLLLTAQKPLAPAYKSLFAEFMLVKLVNVHLLCTVSMNYNMVVIAAVAYRLHKPEIQSA